MNNKYDIDKIYDRVKKKHLKKHKKLMSVNLNETQNSNLHSLTSSPVKISKRNSTKTISYFKNDVEIPESIKKMSINNHKLLHQAKVTHTEISDAQNEEDKLLSIHGNSLKLFYVSLS